MTEAKDKEKLEQAVSDIIRSQAKRFCGDGKVSLDNPEHVQTVANMSAPHIVNLFAAAGQWVKIESESDLPKENGEYDFTFEWLDGEREVRSRYCDVNFRENLRPQYIAWRSKPEPYTE